MATFYLRPSADISLEHSCSTGSTGYNLINEATPDDDGKYIYNEEKGSSSSGSTYTKTSSFTCSGTIPSSYTISSVKFVIRAERAGSSSSDSTIAGSVGSSSLSATNVTTSYTNYEASATTSDLTRSGNTVTATLTAISKLKVYKNDTGSVRITQAFIQVEAVGPCTITTSATGPGTISGTQTVNPGASCTVTITPTTTSGGCIDKVMLDGSTDVTSQLVSQGSYYTYTLSNVQADHSITATFKYFNVYMKQNGAWVRKPIYQKINGTWVLLTSAPTGYVNGDKLKNPVNWVFNKTLQKSVNLIESDDWITTDYIQITPNVAFTVTGGENILGVGFNTYNQDKTYSDYWSNSSTQVVTDVYTRTLSASSVGNSYFVRITIKKSLYNYCKLVQNGVTLFDGSLQPCVEISGNYLCFTANTAGSTVKMTAVEDEGAPPTLNLKYSTDKNTWNTFTVDSTIITLTNVGDKVYFKGTNSSGISSSSGYNKFVMTGSINASGDLTTLLTEEGNVADLTSYGTYTFYQVFLQCEALKTCPVIPSTTLSSNCYSYLFAYSGVTETPLLSASSLASNCYEGMFKACTSLVSAPALPIRNLAPSCYQQMFYGCSNLKYAPELPATTLAAYCYQQMFYNCASLEKAPILPATTLVTRCYYQMFSGCSLINELVVNFTSWNPTTATTGWVNSVSNSGTFKCFSTLGTQSTITRGINNCPTNWNVEDISSTDTTDYLCFTANTAYSTLTMEAVGNAPGLVLYYSTNKTTWNSFIVGSSSITLANIGDKVYFKGINLALAKDISNFNRFVMTGSIAASGDLTTLLHFNGNVLDLSPYKKYTFAHLFEQCAVLTSPPTLPSTTLQEGCYFGLFSECSTLATVPALPATILTNKCYYAMFYKCSVLASTPALSSSSLADECYFLMFHKCNGLTNVPSLPATTMKPYCYYYMFESCEILSTLPRLNAASLSVHCYEGMFRNSKLIKMSTTYDATNYPITYTFGATPNANYALDMFAHTGGTFTETPTAQTYYTSNTIIS